MRPRWMVVAWLGSISACSIVDPSLGFSDGDGDGGSASGPIVRSRDRAGGGARDLGSGHASLNDGGAARPSASDAAGKDAATGAGGVQAPAPTGGASADAGTGGSSSMSSAGSAGSTIGPAGTGGSSGSQAAGASGAGAGGSAGSQAGTGGTAGTSSGGGGAGAGAGGSAGSAPVGQSRCYTTLGNRLLCEGFEQALSTPWWRISDPGMLVVEDTRRRYVGQRALHARAASGNEAWVGRIVLDDGMRSGTLYLRAYVYVPSGPELRTAVAFVLSEVDAPYGGVTVSLTDRGVLLYMHPEGHQTGTSLVVPEPQFPVPRDRWSCFQLQVDISATQGVARLSVDGTAAVASPRMSTLPALGYRGVSAGIVGTGPDQTSVDVHVDELVIDTAPVPCD